MTSLASGSLRFVLPGLVEWHSMNTLLESRDFMASPTLNRLDDFRVRDIAGAESDVAANTGNLGMRRIFQAVSVGEQRYIMPGLLHRERAIAMTHQAVIGRLTACQSSKYEKEKR